MRSRASCLVARPKSLILPLTVDVAQRRHGCQHDSKHDILKGDRRLRLAVGRTHEHYCVDCAKKFIAQSIERLQELDEELKRQ